ncbi:hypothetical protein LX16_4844 [Stackebrandtia albiflava]|uniref:Uncharacterized protein n=1 Tax=Stackebrandtia albiflava TaxID=406432 RepID=A0A562UPY7_9ACTN|nr:hypothetical protein [Stackebrandtia albiflava]TWJ07685.1 hypothetical protein LX16_4844 [Stackebrandtia albiflava]
MTDVAWIRWWHSLPAPDREHIDRLVTEGRMIHAITAIRYATSPKTPLSEAVDLLDWRYRRLDVRAPAGGSRELTVLERPIRDHPGRLTGVEAEWDADTTGWFVTLVAVMADPADRLRLTVIREGDDLRLLESEVPPWPEHGIAVDVGSRLAHRWIVPFRAPPPGP